MAKKTAKTAAGVFLFIFLLIALTPLFIQTRLFKNWLAGFVEKTVNGSINGQLAIGRINGNFFSQIKMRDVRLANAQEILAEIPSLTLDYKLRPLLRHFIMVNKIRIDSPHFFLRQLPDSSWNFSRLLPDSLKSTPKDTIPHKPFNWTIRLDQFELKNLTATITARDSLFPQEIKELSLNCSGEYSRLAKKITLERLTLTTAAPDFHLEKLTFAAEMDTAGLMLRDFALQTAHNSLAAQADWQTTQPWSAEAVLNTAPIDVAEFGFLLPTLVFQGQPSLALHAVFKDDELNAKVSLSSAKSQVDLKARIGNFSYLLGDSTKPEPVYSLDGVIKNVEAADWAPGLRHRIRLNGAFTLNGEGASTKTARAETHITLAKCTLDQHHIDSLVVDATYAKGAMQAQLDFRSEIGAIQARARLRDALALQEFTAEISARHLNLAAILLDSTLASDINFYLTAKGEHFSLEKIKGDAKLSLQPSTFYNQKIDSLFADVSFADQAFDIRDLHVEHEFLAARARGRFSLAAPSDLTVEAHISDLLALAPFLPADTLAGNAAISAHLTGKLDSLNLTADIHADSLLYNTFAVDSLTVRATAYKTADSLSSSATADIRGLDAGSLLLQNVQMTTDISPAMIDVRLDLQQDKNLRAAAHAQYLLNELPVLFLKQVDVNVHGRQWRGGSDSTSIVLGRGEYLVTNLRAQHTNPVATAAQIFADGAIRFDGEEDFLLRVQNFNLAPIGQFLQNQPQLAGVINLEIKLDGTALSPRLAVSVRLTDAGYQNFPLKLLHGNVTYQDEKITVDLVAAPKTDSLRLRGYLPATFSLAEQTFVLHKNQPFDLQLQAPGLPVQNIITPGSLANTISGALSLDVRAQNTLADIRPSGAVTLRNGAVNDDKLGVKMQNLNVSLDIKPDSLVLERLTARQQNGSLSLTGYAALPQGLFSGILDKLQLRLRTNDFFLSQKPEHEIQVDSDISVSGPPDSLRLNGEVEVVRASIYLPALMDKNGAPQNDMAVPLLVSASLAAEADTATADTVQTPAPQKDRPPVVQNLRGAIKLKMPNNVWLRNNNLRVEIGGEIDVVKNADYFELFGAITILRGQYEFLARRFKITEGTVSFQGGETINPTLNIKAEYTFRDANRAKKTIYLVVTDKALNPHIRFMLGEADITEGEAVSYILFNASPEELGDQQTGLAAPSQTRYLATDLVYGLLSAELSRRFGRQIGVDYIEIKGEDNLNAATFVVGKYITPDLFMSYEHSVGTLEEDRTPHVVTVEYELTKFLFLQLISGDTKTTGADIIFKFDK